MLDAANTQRIQHVINFGKVYRLRQHTRIDWGKTFISFNNYELIEPTKIHSHKLISCSLWRTTLQGELFQQWHVDRGGLEWWNETVVIFIEKVNNKGYEIQCLTFSVANIGLLANFL